MKSSSLLLFLTLFIFSCSSSQKLNDNQTQSAIAQSKAISKATFDKEKFPGMAVSVMLDGKIIWSEGFGYADIENKVKVDPSKHLFRIGSVSKTLTAAAMAQQYDNGNLDLYAEVQKYVPDFPKKEYAVKVDEVAHHVAGIRHYQGTEFLSNKKYESVTSALSIFQDSPLLFEPGTKYSYSTYGWNLLSAVIEGASGRQFLDVMENDVFKKAGMSNTFADRADDEMPYRVKFYVKQSGENKEGPAVDNSNKWAGGGFIGTSEDLLKFGDAILNHKLNKKETTQIFWTPYTLKNGKSNNYGLGWRVGEDKKGRAWVGHSGGSMGGTTMFLVYPEEKLIVSTVVNLSSAKMDQLAWKVANQFLTEMGK